MRHGRRDNTHAETRDGWRAIAGPGNVHDTADLGNNFPDLVLGFRGVTFLLEVKSGPRAKMRKGQKAAMWSWFGGPWLRVDGFHDSVAQVKAELAARGVTWDAS